MCKVFAARLFAMAMISAFAGAIAAADEDDFRPVASEDGYFSIELPALPELTVEQFAPGVKFTRLIVKNYRGVAFAAGYLDLPGDPPPTAEARAVIRSFRDATAGKDVRYSDEKSITGGTSSPVPGLEYVGTKEADKKHALRERVYLQSRRLYRLTVIGPTEDVSGKDAEFFFSSFSFSANPKERVVDWDVTKLSDQAREKLSVAAPNVKWSAAKLTKGAQVQEGKLIETYELQLTGEDKQGHEILVTVERDDTLGEISTVLEFGELPVDIQKTVLTRGAAFGKPTYIYAIGPSTSKPERYEFSYLQGSMTVGVDGKNVNTFGLE